MRIEILVDKEEPKIFPLNKPKVMIGSQETCDIVLRTGNVSRKHLMIINEDDFYYVVDQGTTNGSYINEERLVPGRKIEFTSFFPVRLGDNVLVTLLSDEDAHDLGYSGQAAGESTSPNLKMPVPDEATRTISLKELQNAKTEHLVKKRQETVVKRRSVTRPSAKVKSKDSSRMFRVMIFCCSLVGVTAYYNIYVKVPQKTKIDPTAKVNIPVSKKIAPVADRFPLVAKADLTPIEKFEEILKSIPCSNDIEKAFCEQFPNGPTLVIQTGTMINLFLNGKDYFQKARDLIPPYVLKEGELPDERKERKYNNGLKLTAVLLFLRDNIRPDFRYDLVKGLNLTFAIYLTVAEGAEGYVPVAITPESLQKLMVTLSDPAHFNRARDYGADSLFFMKDYFRLY